jgi:metacaspase-1
MCWRKIASWFKPDPVVENKNKTALLFAINNYPGAANDLNGCINDQNDVADKLESLFPGEWSVVKFKDSEVTKSNFRNTIKNYIVGMSSGDTLLIGYSGHGSYGASGKEVDGYSECLYLFDEALWDWELIEILKLTPRGAKIILILDSCFADGASRHFNLVYNKPRFIQIQNINPDVKKKDIDLKPEEVTWVTFSACRETETSADALINGRYNGAFSYYFIRALNKGKTYRQVADDTIYAIYKGGFEQVPTLRGNEEIIKQLIFS